MSDHTSELSQLKKCRRGDQCIHPDGPLLPHSEFGAHKKGRNGLKARCKKCSNAENTAWNQAHREQRRASGIRHRIANPEKAKERDARRRKLNPSALALRRLSGRRVCLKCGIEYPRTAEHFHRNSRLSDGLSYRCKSCAIKATRSHYQENIEERREVGKRYREENPEKVLAASLKWQRNNPEKLRVRRQRRESRKKALPAQLTADEWQWLLEQSGHCCVYCGKHESEVGPLAQEHVVPLSKGGGYTIFNIRPSCTSDNSRKGPRTPEQAGMKMVIEINPLAYMEQLSLFGDSAA